MGVVDRVDKEPRVCVRSCFPLVWDWEQRVLRMCLFASTVCCSCVKGCSRLQCHECSRSTSRTMILHGSESHSHPSTYQVAERLNQSTKGRWLMTNIPHHLWRWNYRNRIGTSTEMRYVMGAIKEDVEQAGKAHQIQAPVLVCGSSTVV